MGCSQSWLAVKGMTRETVLKSLGLRAASDRRNSQIEAAELPTGWYLVVGDQSEQPILGEEAARRLSHDSDVIIGEVEEHVMVSMAAAWREGFQLWSVLHDAQQDVEHLESSGDLPAEYESIREQLVLQQTAAGGRNAQVDFLFDVPVELAFRLTGYRYDTDLPGAHFEPLGTVAISLPTWWKRLLGR